MYIQYWGHHGIGNVYQYVDFCVVFMLCCGTITISSIPAAWAVYTFLALFKAPGVCKGIVKLLIHTSCNAGF